MTTRLAVLPTLGFVLSVFSASSAGADSDAGKAVFRAQCALCHTAQAGDNGGAQGPNLHDVYGRGAATDASFSYTKPLRESGLTWDAATLDRFLASPTTVVPGSSMVVAVPGKDDRSNVVAYLQAVKSTAPDPASVPPANTAAAQADWKLDAPGRTHRIDVANLAAPFATPSVRNNPRLIEKPADAKLSVPPGFAVNVFATGLEGPRTMRIAPNGDVFVAESRAGRIKVMRPAADGTTAAKTQTFIAGLKQPFGMQFYPSGKNPKYFYVAEVNRVVRYAYKSGDMKASGDAEVVVAELSPDASGGHVTRDLAFSPDGKRMFVSVGSATNVAEGVPKKTAAEIKEWEAEYGLGASWGRETKRASVLVFDVGSNKPGRIFATGIRNCVGLTVQPATGELWCTTNERDLLGDNLVPDYSTRVKEGGYYGWPWYYMGNHEDPRLKGDRPDLAGKAIVPDVPFQAHSAALTLTFYPKSSGKAAFPQEYAGDGFAMLHGSWNRAFRTGHKIVRVKMKDGVPTGEYEDFLVGFIADDGNAWGRPVGGAVASDGALLMSDDGGNLVYRVSYSR